MGLMLVFGNLTASTVLISQTIPASSTITESVTFLEPKSTHLNQGALEVSPKCSSIMAMLMLIS